MYFILAISAFLIYILAHAKTNSTFIYRNRDKIYLFFFFLFAALIMGLRSVQVGIDTHMYEIHFDRVVTTSWQNIFKNLHGLKFDYFEIGFVILEKISGMFVNNYYFFQLLVASIYCFSIMTFFKDDVDSKIILTTVFLGSGLYLTAFNISRQMLAVALTSLCWRSLCRGKKIKALVMMVLAVTVHVSSVVFAVAFLVYLIRKKKYLLYTAIFLGIIAAVNYEAVIHFIDIYFDVYYDYVSNNRQLVEMNFSIFLYIIILVLALYILIKKNFDSKECIYAAFSTAYVACIFIGLKFNYFERIGIYFLPFTVLLMDTIGKRIKSKEFALFYKNSVAVCYTVYFLLSSTATQYIYHFFWK